MVFPSIAILPAFDCAVIFSVTLPSLVLISQVTVGEIRPDCVIGAMHSQVSMARSRILSAEFCMWGSSLSLVSVAVMKHCSENQLGEERFNLAYMSQSTHHWGKSEQAPGGRNWSRGLGRRLPAGLHSRILGLFSLLSYTALIICPVGHCSQWAGHSSINHQSRKWPTEFLHFFSWVLLSIEVPTSKMTRAGVKWTKRWSCSWLWCFEAQLREYWLFCLR